MSQTTCGVRRCDACLVMHVTVTFGANGCCHDESFSSPGCSELSSRNLDNDMGCSLVETSLPYYFLVLQTELVH